MDLPPSLRLPPAAARHGLRIIRSTGREARDFRENARAVREKFHGNRVFVRAVVEVSNHCRQNCSYCGMRRDNRELPRYRADLDSTAAHILQNCPPAVTDLNIQAGEDPVAIREVVLPLIRILKKETRLGISLCLGTLSPKEYHLLGEAGAGYYILKLETGDPEHYREIRAPGTLEKRLEAIEHLAATGWQVSSGFILGLPGQSEEGLLRTLETLHRLPLAGVSVSPFISGESTPLNAAAPCDADAALNAVAALRLLAPHRIIPAVSAFNLVREGAYADALRSGANLVTLNLTPPRLRGNYEIYSKHRFIMEEENALRAIEQAGCVPSAISLIAAPAGLAAA